MRCKKRNLKNKKIIIFWILSFLTAAFLIYCFYPVLTYDTRYLKHVTNSPLESLAPGRIFLTDRNGEVITDKMYPNGYYKFIETDMNSEFVTALVEIEDKNYYSHWGVNLPSKLRAIRDNIAGKRISGGSTITEQYVKNKYFLWIERSYTQKLREAVLALYFTICSPSSREMPERQGEFLWKDRILNLYMHDAYFGNQLYGVGAAIEVYFGKDSLEQLTQEEIVILLSLLNNPGIQTLEEEYFQEYFTKIKERLGYEFKRTYFWKLPTKQNIDRFPFVTQKWINREMTQAQFPLNTVDNLLPLGEGELSKSSFVEGDGWTSMNSQRIIFNNELWSMVSVDSTLQDFARDTLQQTLWELADKNVTNGAIFAMIPSTGEILIYQGSKDFFARDIDGQVDVITSLRQPGSTMKPFLYLMALESGANPDELLLDIESEYNSFQQGSVYISENYSLKEYGLVRLKKALWNSFNNATVRLAKELWLTQVYDYYKNYDFQLDFPAEHYGYSLVLWNPSLSLKKLVYSYAKLLDLEDENKFLLYDILSDPDNRDVSFGVNSILNTSIPQAVKTGTSSDFKDNLVISYHPDLVVWVWVGNNDNSSMNWVTGITGAGYIWKQVAEKAIELWYVQHRNINIPEWIVESSYCLDSNCLRRENIYSKADKQYFSKISEWIYDSRDMFEQLSEYELERLDELRINFQ